MNKCPDGFICMDNTQMIYITVTLLIVMYFFYEGKADGNWHENS